MLCRALTLFALSSLAACGSPEAPAEPAPTPVAAPVAAIAEEPLEAELPEPPAEITASTHEVLVLVVHEEPLLPSEQRLLDVLEARLSRRTDLELREASPEEAAVAAAHWARQPAPPAPGTFGSARRVLFLRVPAPRRLSDGDRVTRGFSGALLLRPPAVEPSIMVAIDDVSSWRATDDRWASWLAGLLREPEAG